MCPHHPPCPPADRPDTIAFHPEQGWSLLCNGIILFDDTGMLLPDGRGSFAVSTAAPDRGAAGRLVTSHIGG